VFTVVAAVGSVGIIGAVIRRIGGPRAKRVHLSRDGVTVIAAGAGDTDPGHGADLERLAADVDSLRDEVTGLRREMDEAQNRLDFTERLLAQARDRGLLNASKER
jgi:hypothetical protein